MKKDFRCTGSEEGQERNKRAYEERRMLYDMLAAINCQKLERLFLNRDIYLVQLLIDSMTDKSSVKNLDFFNLIYLDIII